MTLQLRNTLTREVEPVEPIDGERLRMYSCGPTVYRYAHVGNLRTFLLADLIRRVVLYHGTPVLQVQNITDVGHLRDERFDRGEDRMLVAAGLEHKTPAEIADAYEAAFHADAALLNLLPAHVYPRATEHIPEMLELAEHLVDAGHAYVSDAGNVYYSVASFPGYGALSGNTLDALRAGHRGEVEADKRDPADFALWKAAGEGRMLKWPTARWGEGYPGWHLECSAMALRLLGEPPIDIHAGGIDLIFPHHENEIAQSEGATGRQFSRFWVHVEYLIVDEQKMSKSLGNTYTIPDVVAKGFRPSAVRYLLLSAHYRKQLNFTWDSLAAAEKALQRLSDFLVRVEGVTQPGSHAELAARVEAARTAFANAMRDDLNTAAALGAIFELVSDLNSAIDAGGMGTDDVAAVKAAFADFDRVLGVLSLRRAEEERPPVPVDEIERMIEDRQAARRRRDFAAADRIRDDLAARGVLLEDSAAGTRWKRK